MRFAVICDDPALPTWLDAMGDDSAHDIVAAVVSSDQMAEFFLGRSGIRLVSGWEDLLVARDVDAILVGGSSPAILDAIRQLATAGRTLLIIPRGSQSLMFMYELGLIRDDNHVKLIPAIEARYDAALVRLKSLIFESTFGPVRLIQCERGLPTATASEPIPISTVDELLLQDSNLIGWLGGTYDQVTAIRTGSANDAVVTQTVTLAGRGLPEAIWQATSISGEAVRRIVVHAERGRAIVEFNSSSGQWNLTEPDGAKTSGDRVAAARSLIDDCCSTSTESRSPIEWQELVRAFEIVDASHRSVRRRRTIDLHFEKMSERAAFKSQMTAIGCSVLMATFFLSLAYLGVASLVPAPDPSQPASAAEINDGWRVVRSVLGVVRYLVFAPLAIFLLLQFLYPLARPGEGEKNEQRVNS